MRESVCKLRFVTNMVYFSMCTSQDDGQAEGGRLVLHPLRKRKVE